MTSTTRTVSLRDHRQLGTRGHPDQGADPREPARGAAYRDDGKGSRHPAQLNFGDCFAYALARVTGEPLLFVGNDLGHTDVRDARSG